MGRMGSRPPTCWRGWRSGETPTPPGGPVSPEAAPGRAVTGPSPPGVWPAGFVAGRADRDALLVLAHLEGITPADRHRLGWRGGAGGGCLGRALGARGP